MTENENSKELRNVKQYVEVVYRHHGSVICEINQRTVNDIPWNKIFNENRIKLGDSVERYRYFDVVISKDSNCETVQTKGNISEFFDGRIAPKADEKPRIQIHIMKNTSPHEKPDLSKTMFGSLLADLAEESGMTVDEYLKEVLRPEQHATESQKDTAAV